MEGEMTGAGLPRDAVGREAPPGTESAQGHSLSHPRAGVWGLMTTMEPCLWCPQASLQTGGGVGIAAIGKGVSGHE